MTREVREIRGVCGRHRKQEYREKLRRVFYCVFCSACICCLSFWLPFTAFAQEAWESGKSRQEENNAAFGEEIWEDSLDFSDIQEYLDALGEGKSRISFREMISMILDGKWKEAGEIVLASVTDSLFSEISSGSRIFIQILVIGIAGAVFANFASVFDKSQIADAGFYITYLLLFSLLAAGFLTALDVAVQVMDKVTGFLRVLMPAYFMAVAFAGNAAGAVVMYEAMLFGVYALEKVVQLLLVPLLKLYIFLVLAGHISREDMLSKMTELVEKIIQWTMKTMLGAVVGVQLLQGMVLPYADSLKTGMLQKVIQVIPGIGQATGTAMQMVLGSGVLIKNTIGAAAVVILAAVCILPVIKLALLMLFYHLAAAVLQPVCDTRMVSCIAKVAQGHKLLLDMVLVMFVLFVLSIAVVCASSNAAYFSG